MLSLSLSLDSIAVVGRGGTAAADMIAVTFAARRLNDATTTNASNTVPIAAAALLDKAGAQYTPVQGDLVVITFFHASAAAGDVTISTNSSGWTKVDEIFADGSSFDLNAAMFYKFMGAVPDASLAVQISGGTGAGNAHQYGVNIFKGADLTSPIVVQSATQGNPQSTRLDPPSITPTITGSLVAVAGASVAAAGVLPDDTGYVVGTFKPTISATTNDVSGVLGVYVEDWQSSAVNPPLFGAGPAGTTGAWGGWTFAVQPTVGA